MRENALTTNWEIFQGVDNPYEFIWVAGGADGLRPGRRRIGRLKTPNAPRASGEVSVYTFF